VAQTAYRIGQGRAITFCTPWFEAALPWGGEMLKLSPLIFFLLLLCNASP